MNQAAALSSDATQQKQEKPRPSSMKKCILILNALIKAVTCIFWLEVDRAPSMWQSLRLARLFPSAWLVHFDTSYRCSGRVTLCLSHVIRGTRRFLFLCMSSGNFSVDLEAMTLMECVG